MITYSQSYSLDFVCPPLVTNNTQFQLYSLYSCVYNNSITSAFFITPYNIDCLSCNNLSIRYLVWINPRIYVVFERKWFVQYVDV